PARAPGAGEVQVAADQGQEVVTRHREPYLRLLARRAGAGVVDVDAPAVEPAGEGHVQVGDVAADGAVQGGGRAHVAPCAAHGVRELVECRTALLDRGHRGRRYRRRSR